MILYDLFYSSQVKSHSEYSDPVVLSEIFDLVGVKTKPVTPSSPTPNLTNPQDIVKQISKTPHNIISKTPLVPLFNSKPPTTQPDLTADEQGTMERLSSCQDSAIIEALPTWNTKDRALSSIATDSELLAENRSSPFRRVMSLPQKLGLSTLAQSSKGNEFLSEEAVTETRFSVEDDPCDCAMKDTNGPKSSVSNSLCLPVDDWGDCLISKDMPRLGRQRRHSSGEALLGKIRHSLQFDKKESRFENLKLFGDKNISEDQTASTSLSQHQTVVSEEGCNKYKDVFKNPRQKAISLFAKHNFLGSSKENIASIMEHETVKEEAHDLARAEESINRPYNAASVNTRSPVHTSDSNIDKSTRRSQPQGTFFGKMRKNMDVVISTPMMRRNKEFNAESKDNSLQTDIHDYADDFQKSAR